MPRRAEADILAAQRAVLAEVRRGASSRAEAGRLAGENPRTLDKWWEKDTLGWRKQVAQAEGKRESRWEKRAAEVPDRQTFRKAFFGHDTYPHQQEWFNAIDANNRILILAPPESSKTTTIAEEYVIERICRDRNLRAIIVSKTQDVAQKRLYRIAQRLTDPTWYVRNKLRNLPEELGPFKPAMSSKVGSSPWSAKAFYVSGIDSGERDPTLEALGVGNQIQGARADLIVLDDIGTLANQMTELVRERILDWLAQEVITRLGPEGKLVIIATRVSEQDIYGTLLEDGTFHQIIQPAITDEEKGEVLCPELWSFPDLMARKAELEAKGRLRTWLLTYQQQATGLPDAPFSMESIERSKQADLNIGDKASHLRVVAGVDPAFTGVAAIVVVGLDKATGQRYVIDAPAKTGLRTNDNLKDFIVGVCATYGVSEARVEKNAMQGGLARDSDLVARLQSVGTHLVEEYTSVHNKFDDNLGVTMVAGMVDAGRYTFPWAYGARSVIGPLLDEMAAWRAEKGWTTERRFRQRQDRVMALWLAELACRRYEMVGDLPKPSKRVPRFVRKSFDHRMARVR